jgi:spore protease
MGIRTDLALEALSEKLGTAGELTAIDGVRATHEVRGGFGITRVEVLDEKGCAALGKPMGIYTTVEFDSIPHRETNDFSRLIEIVSHETSRIAKLTPADSALVVGLGNREITPDCVGPYTADRILVTRHLRTQVPAHFAAMREVSAFCPNVLGNTGVESAELVALLSGAIKPTIIIVVDALAASDAAHLCRTIQITNTGIAPGSGVKNSRAELSCSTLGVPTIAIGVPTVVAASTLNGGAEYENLILTSKDIDSEVTRLSQILAYSINTALQSDMTLSELDALLL